MLTSNPDRRFLLAMVVLCVVLRFPALMWPLMPDEAGYFLVARGWDPQPGNMHGTYWVDRPPTLIAVFWVAHLLGSAYVPRAVVVALTVLMTVAAYRAGMLMFGPRAARWSAAASVALMCNPVLPTWATQGSTQGSRW